MIDPLIVDCYAKDFGGKPDIAALVAAGYPWCGISLKATEGTYYTGGEWFQAHWLPARELGLERYGAAVGALKVAQLAIGERVVPWYRQAYHYFRVDQDPIQQADLFLKTMQLAGGHGPGDLWPMIDVESGSNPPTASAAQIEDGVSRFASKITSALGITPMLYGNIYLWERGVRSHMNCGTLTVARYAKDLPATTYQRIGWDITQPPAMPTMWGWQYCGDPDGGALPGYPTHCPMSAIEPADTIAIIVGGGADPQACLDWTTANLGR